VLTLNGGFLNRTDKNAEVNTNFSFFKKSKSYRENPPVTEIKINAVTAGFKIDFRNYIEDGLFRRRSSFGNSFIIFEGNLTHSNKNLLNSGVDFTRYELRTYGKLNTFNSADLGFRIFAQSIDGFL